MGVGVRLLSPVRRLNVVCVGNPIFYQLKGTIGVEALGMRVQDSEFLLVYRDFRVILGLYRGHIGKMEKKMETTI